jgi:hypothetical protein
MVAPSPTVNPYVTTPMKNGPEMLQRNALKQNEMNRTYAGGATAPILGSRYVSYSGPGQTPEDTQKQIAGNALQSQANSTYDKFAYMKGGKKTAKRRRRRVCKCRCCTKRRRRLRSRY